MKKLLIFLSATLLFSCGIIQQNKAVDYNNSLIGEQEKVAEHINEFMDMIQNTDTLSHDIIQSKRTEVLNSIDESIKNVEEIGNFENTSNFKNSIIKVLNAYRNGVKNEYTELANYMLLPPEEQTPGRYFETENTAYQADSLISVAEGDFIDAQKVFADEHKIKLSPIPVQ